MLRPPPRSTLKLCRRQRQMCIRDSNRAGKYFFCLSKNEIKIL
nr:hypothetical protein [Pedobacter sp. ASV2]